MSDKVTMHLVLCTNDQIHDPLLVTIGSALRSCRSSPVAIHIVTTGLSEDYIVRLRRLCSRLGASEFDIVEMDPNIFSDFQCTAWISKETYLRFLLASLFPHLDRIIYLDCDLLVRRDLYPLWDMPLDGFACAGSDKEWAHDPRYCEQIGLTSSDVYVNAGVLIMNLRRFREHDLGNRLMSFARNAKTRFPCLGQDVLNLVLRGQITVIPFSWNYTSYEYRTRRRMATEAAVLHFTGSAKPWPTKGKRCWDWRGWLWRKNYYALERILSSPAGGNPPRMRFEERFACCMEWVTRMYLTLR